MFYVRRTVPTFDEFGNQSPFVSIKGMKLDEFELLLSSPFVFVDSGFEVVVVAFSALLAAAAVHSVEFAHLFGNLAPFSNSFLLVELLENSVFLG